MKLYFVLYSIELSRDLLYLLEKSDMLFCFLYLTYCITLVLKNKINMTNDYMFRAVLYLCRSFDQLNHGQNYNEIKPVIHIGFLDYTLFEEYPEFYTTYKLINVNNHHIYSDNITLSVVNLSKIDLATEEDRKYHIDKWAALFKAKTWEEIKMIAGNSEYLSEATKSIFQMCSDAQVRKMCLEIEEYHLDMQCFQRIIAEQKEALAMKDGTLAKQEDIIRQLKSENELLRSQIK